MPQGVKRIYDLGVFGVTATFSIFAYVWMWIVLLDQTVEMWEAVLTFLFTFVLVGIAYGADRYKAYTESLNKVEDENDSAALTGPQVDFTLKELVNELVKEKAQGVSNASDDEIKKRREMK